MKIKKNNKKLVFNKSTVAHLEMKKLKGGCLPTCPKCCPTFETVCYPTCLLTVCIRCDF